MAKIHVFPRDLSTSHKTTNMESLGHLRTRDQRRTDASARSLARRTRLRPTRGSSNHAENRERAPRCDLVLLPRACQIELCLLIAFKSFLREPPCAGSPSRPHAVFSSAAWIAQHGLLTLQRRLHEGARVGKVHCIEAAHGGRSPDHVAGRARTSVLQRRRSAASEGDAHFVPLHGAGAPTGPDRLEPGPAPTTRPNEAGPTRSGAARARARGRALREIWLPRPRPVRAFQRLQIDGGVGADGYHSGIRRPDRTPLATATCPSAARRARQEIRRRAQRHPDSVRGPPQKQPTTRATDGHRSLRIRTGARGFEPGSRSVPPSSVRDRKEVLGFWNTGAAVRARIPPTQGRALRVSAWRGNPASVQRILPHARSITCAPGKPCNQARGAYLHQATRTPGAASSCAERPCASALEPAGRRASFILQATMHDAGLPDVNTPELSWEAAAVSVRLRSRRGLPRWSPRTARVALTEYHVADGFRAANFCSVIARGLRARRNAVLFARSRGTPAALVARFGEQDC